MRGEEVGGEQEKGMGPGTGSQAEEWREEVVVVEEEEVEEVEVAEEVLVVALLVV